MMRHKMMDALRHSVLRLGLGLAFACGLPLAAHALTALTDLAPALASRLKLVASLDIAERRKPQKILVDVGMELDVAPAAAADDFRKTVDYWAVEKLLRAEAETGERALIRSRRTHCKDCWLRSTKPSSTRS